MVGPFQKIINSHCPLPPTPRAIFPPANKKKTNNELPKTKDSQSSQEKTSHPNQKEKNCPPSSIPEKKKSARNITYKKKQAPNYTVI
jgi:hypothetical protein